MVARMTDRYAYSDLEWAEVGSMVRRAVPVGYRIQRSDRLADFAGVDATLLVNGRCPIAFRIRRSWPATSPDQDVTFRDTEPAKMTAQTYAPLILYCWFRGGYAVCGKLIDVYRLRQLDPRLSTRDVTRNPDGTGFHVVTIAELVAIGALLFQGDRESFAPACLQARVRLAKILDTWTPAI
jgi:hypothetical protein